MNQPASQVMGDRLFYGIPVSLFLAILAVVCAAIVFSDGLELMVLWWERDEYSHGYMIPLVAAFMFWQKTPELAQQQSRGAYLSIVVLLFGLFLFVLGELSTVYTLMQYGFLLAFYSIVIATLGVRGTKVTWAALVYLLFMIPLPNFIYNNLSSQLQLISSDLGVAFLRLVGVSVYLEGNVIDLGAYKLQVVEACSGLRYLFPLTSFSFLIAYLYRGPVWLKLLIFISAAPITILMNSFRIGIIGITVDNWGIEMAEGFLHSFEGWFIFLACLLLLFIEIWILDRFVRTDGSFVDQFNLDYPPLNFRLLSDQAGSQNTQRSAHRLPLLICLGLLIITVPVATMIGEREDVIPQRMSFSNFPLLQNEWLGREGRIDADVLSSLKLSDHFIADYSHPDYLLPINLYVAYYGNQRKGASAHSPQSCIPGGGWVIETVDTVELNDVFDSMSPTVSLQANRTIIRKGDTKQLVYYWFQQRGRIITNEYLAKWYIFWDAMTRNRTDGAMVRLVVPVPDGTTVESVEAQLKVFIRDFYPQLIRYIPE